MLCPPALHDDLIQVHTQSPYATLLILTVSPSRDSPAVLLAPSATTTMYKTLPLRDLRSLLSPDCHKKHHSDGNEDHS